MFSIFFSFLFFFFFLKYDPFSSNVPSSVRENFQLVKEYSQSFPFGILLQGDAMVGRAFFWEGGSQLYQSSPFDACDCMCTHQHTHHYFDVRNKLHTSLMFMTLIVCDIGTKKVKDIVHELDQKKMGIWYWWLDKT